MGSLSLVPKQINQTSSEPNDTSTNNTLADQDSHLQEKRETFDRALDEALEGLAEARHVLNELKTRCFFAATTAATPMVKLKVQRASHHCNRLMDEIQELLKPLSHDLMAVFTITDSLTDPIEKQIDE
jgi:hypothetical protein